LKAALTIKKEKLFRENPKNLRKWEIPQSQINDAIKVANNAEEAFKIMLP